LTVFSPGADAPSFRNDAVPSRDWSTVVRSSWTKGLTQISAVDPSAGAVLWDQDLAGRLRVKLTGEGGGMVALGPMRERLFSYGRAHTRLTIAGQSMSEPKTLTLDGNYEPEAFSTDTKSLFVIRFLPARAPTSYQVRRLDLETGKVLPVYTPDADLQKAMGGTARIQTGSPDGTRLYTLYTAVNGGARYAFIHVLSLDELWAHCIDLPPEFAKHAQSATSISVSADGSRLYVVNAHSGVMAEIDTQTLQVVRTAPIEFDFASSVHSVTDQANSAVYFTSGNTVAAVDASNLEVKGAWEMPQKVMGIQVGSDGRRLYVGLIDSIAVLDSSTGERLDTLNPPGVNTIQEFGPVLRALDQGDIVCAC
jgi:hypothetical protein